MTPPKPSLKLNAWPQIIEAGLDELVEIVDFGQTSSVEIFYATCIVHFLRGHHLELEHCVRLCKKEFPAEFELQTAVELRCLIRSRALNSEILEQAILLLSGSLKWRGELAILIATGFTILGQHTEARTWFQYAICPLEEIGSFKKSVKARLNVLVAETHLDKTRHRIPEYFDLFKKASNCGEHLVAGTCLLNISREYQLMGSSLAALKYVNDAVELSEKHFGSLQHHLALVHRCHLLKTMNRWSEARLDYELALASSFPEVKAALQVLSENQSQSASKAGTQALPSWVEREQEIAPLSLSAMETQLVEFLSEKARTRIEIVEHLYGNQLDWDVCFNRFKSLLGTLRKKSPGLVENESGYYRLNERLRTLQKRHA